MQSVSQLESVYGRADARTFVTNHAMQIIYAPREQKDANEYSEMLGTFTDRSRSVSRSNAIFGGRGGASESFSEQRRPLLLPQELKELGREKEIILLENTKPILADRICYWRDPVFTSRLAAAPHIPVMDLARFTAQIERRLRELQPDDVDEAGVVRVPAEYLEVLQARDPRDLPGYLADISIEDAAAYVERHFMLLGVPAQRIAAASRRLSPADLDVAELRPADAVSRRKASRGTDGTDRTPARRRGCASPRTVDGSDVLPLHGERR